MINLEPADKKILFTRCRNEVNLSKSPRYIKWLKAKYPGREPHHLLGSTLGLKYTDHLIVMLTREEHKECEPKIGSSHYNKAEAFIKYLPQAINNLVSYVEFLNSGAGQSNSAY